MGELTTRDDFKDTIAYPRLYYPGMLLALSSGDGPEQHVTVLEVRDHNGPWVTVVYRPTTRVDLARDWCRVRRLKARWWLFLAKLWLREKLVTRVEDGHE
jgi:hypothetical protein